jgi:hypothetical protein
MERELPMSGNSTTDWSALIGANLVIPQAIRTQMQLTNLLSLISSSNEQVNCSCVRNEQKSWFFRQIRSSESAYLHNRLHLLTLKMKYKDYFRTIHLSAYAPQHFLYFFPLPQGQGSLRPALFGFEFE